MGVTGAHLMITVLSRWKVSSFMMAEASGNALWNQILVSIFILYKVRDAFSVILLQTLILNH